MTSRPATTHAATPAPSPLVRIIPCAPRPSRRLLRALAHFGLAVRRDPDAPPPHAPEPATLALLLKLPPGSLALITGPSGSGKTTLLRTVAAQLARRGYTIITALPALRPGTRSVIDIIPGPLDAALRTLAAAGLADAPLLARAPAHLSEGERARLSLAIAMAHAHREPRTRPLALCIDEFASTLDRATARALAVTLRRWVARTPNLRALCATAHDDLLEPLSPALHHHTPLRPAA